MVPPPSNTPSSFSSIFDPIVSSTDLPNYNPPPSFDPNHSSSLPTSHNSLPIVTRSKHGIYKPKVLLVKHDYSVTKPPSYAVAGKHPQWVATTDSEFQSLQKQKT